MLIAGIPTQFGTQHLDTFFHLVEIMKKLFLYIRYQWMNNESLNAKQALSELVKIINVRDWQLNITQRAKENNSTVKILPGHKILNIHMIEVHFYRQLYTKWSMCQEIISHFKQHEATVTWVMAHCAWIHSISSWGNTDIPFSYWFACTSRELYADINEGILWSEFKVMNHGGWKSQNFHIHCWCVLISVKPNCHPINVWVTDIFLVQYFLQHEWNISPGHYKVFPGLSPGGTSAANSNIMYTKQGNTRMAISGNKNFSRK